jgi:sulfite exporter TauE/SafE
MSLAALAGALAFGLLGSSHCVAMCGGVVAMTCSALPLQRRRRWRHQLGYALAYNAGRITSYAAAGGLAGAVGGAVLCFGAFERLQLGLRVFAALAMLASGLAIAGFGGAWRWMERVGQPLWRRVAPLARSILPVRSPLHAVALGLLWGWMPCGLVYGALALAVSSGSPSAGAWTMLAFGLGTLPMLLTLGSAAALLVRGLRHPTVRASAGTLLVLLGLFHVIDSGRAWAAASSDASRVCCFLLHHR